MHLIKPITAIALATLLITGCGQNEKHGIAVTLPSQFTCQGEQSSSQATEQLSDSQFVYAAYSLVLGRDPDQGGFNVTCSALKKDGMSRQQVLQNMVASPEFLQKLKQAAEAKATIAAGGVGK